MLKRWAHTVPKMSPFREKNNMNKDVKQMGCVTISRNGYIQELEEQLRQERELADKLAVELSACNNTWIFNENDNVVEALKMWRELRKI